MVENAKVSVALCSHNGAAYIGAQIRSILSQSRLVDEIVVSDDASSDRTVEIVENAFASRLKSGPDLDIIKNKDPLRVTKNFEKAIGATTGELVLLADQDDVWREDKVEVLVNEMSLAGSKTLLTCTNARNVDDQGEPLGYTLFQALEITNSERTLISEGRSYEAFLRRNLVTGATVIFRRELYELARPFPDAWLHDEWLAIVAAAHNGVQMLDECLIDYRQHSANQVGMAKMTIAAKFFKFREPRAERNSRLYRRAKQLNEYMQSAEGVTTEHRRMAAEKLQFEEARQRYPARRISRIPHIARQLFAGNYRQYGTGLKDAIRNLLQPI